MGARLIGCGNCSMGYVYLGARGDIIPTKAVYISAIKPGNNLYDASGNIYWTNNTGNTVQGGSVINLIDAGNKQFMLQIDTNNTNAPDALNIGIVYTAPITPDPITDADAYAYLYAGGTTASNKGTSNQPGPGTSDSGSGTGSGTSLLWLGLGVLALGLILGHND